VVDHRVEGPIFGIVAASIALTVFNTQGVFYFYGTIHAVRSGAIAVVVVLSLVLNGACILSEKKGRQSASYFLGITALILNVIVALAVFSYVSQQSLPAR